MVSFSRTVGTPGNLSLCTGKAIFLINGMDMALPLGYQTAFGNGGDGEHGSVSGTFFAGVCGPAWALRMDVAGETTGNRIALAPMSHQCIAGTLCGIRAGVNVDLHTEIFWTEVGFSLGLEADLLEALLAVIKFATGRDLLPEVEKGRWATVKSYGFMDTGGGTLGPGLAIKRQPTVTTEWDLFLYMLYTTAPYAVKEWEAVKWVFNVAFGIELKTTLNVELNLASVSVGSAEYKGLAWEAATSKVTGTTSSSAVPSAGDGVKVKFHEVPSISFGIGLFFSASILQVIGIRFDWVFPILESLGYSLLGEYDQTVDSTAFGAPCVPCGEAVPSAPTYVVEFA